MRPRNRGFLPKKFFITLLIIFNILLLAFLLNATGAKLPEAQVSELMETEELASLKTFEEVSKFLSTLAEEKGAEYAYEVLRQSRIGQNLDMHLLGHVVGDALYKQKGAAGIAVCTDDFRNACSHSIVVGLLLEKGESALDEITAACKQAPGGEGAYTMCFHGLGHGVLAYLGYDLEKAVDMCQRMGVGSESQQCVGGTIMEIVGGGFHSRELWEAQSKKYFKQEDPLYPCNSSFIPQSSKSMCYVYLTPQLLRAAGADLGNPTPADFEKAFRFCDRLPKEDSNRATCFGSFGKEFVVLAGNRDIRKAAVNNLTNEQLNKVEDWCILAGEHDGTISCIVHALQSLYWGGENDRGVSIRFCSLLSDEERKGACFSNLIGAVEFYIKDLKYKSGFCAELDTFYQDICREKLLQN